jgi:neurofibromin 1
MLADYKVQVTSLVGDWNVIRRPRASLDLPTNQHDLLCEILQLYSLDPQYALSGTMTGGAEGLGDILRVTSTLMVSPSPGNVRTIATRCNVALLEAIAGEDESMIAGNGDSM